MKVLVGAVATFQAGGAGRQYHEVQLAAEVRARARTLQERCPGARARAPRQKGAQTDRRLS